MKTIDQYHKWVEWSEQDQVYIGKCPDLITGIHGEHPVQVYQELCEVIEEVIEHFRKTGRQLPASRTRPMMEVA
jgi:predicted RNase H-like HicB family nuclease